MTTLKEIGPYRLTLTDNTFEITKGRHVITTTTNGQRAIEIFCNLEQIEKEKER